MFPQEYHWSSVNHHFFVPLEGLNFEDEHKWNHNLPTKTELFENLQPLSWVYGVKINLNV